MQQPDAPECAGAEEGNSGAGRVVSPARRPRPGGPDRARQGAGAACAARQRRRRPLRRPRRAGRWRAPPASASGSTTRKCAMCACLGRLVYALIWCTAPSVGLAALAAHPASSFPRPQAREMCNHGAHNHTSLSFHAHLSHVARCGLCACGALCPLYCSVGLSNAALPCKAKQTPPHCKSHGC